MIDVEAFAVSDVPDPKWLVEKDGVTRKVFEQFCYTKISTFPSAEQMRTAVVHSEWHGESKEYTQVDYVVDTFIDMVAGKTLNFAEMII